MLLQEAGFPPVSTISPLFQNSPSGKKKIFFYKDKREPSNKPVVFLTRGNAAQKATFTVQV